MKLSAIATVFLATSLSCCYGNILGRIHSLAADRWQNIRDRAQAFVGDVVDDFVNSQVEHATFCREYDCPAYVLLEKKDKYEVRHYNATYWVSTSADRGSSSTFMKLFRYIQGANDRDETIAMTVPVLMKYGGAGDVSEGRSDKKSMSFYLTQPDAPTPTDSDVYLENQMNGITVYVRSFSGFTWGWGRWARQAIILRDALNDDGLGDTYQPDFYTAGYNKPWTMRNRHNEVWFIKKSPQVATPAEEESNEIPWVTK